MYNVVCIKWGDKYGPNFVNILRAMVKRNLSFPHRFICFTEDSSGLDDDIEILPLIETELKGWWHKLTLFKPKLFDLSGKTLYLDLDVVIVNSLDPMFEREEKFSIIADWAYARRHIRGKDKIKIMYNSSVFMYDIGAHPNVWDEFAVNPERISKRHPGGDQEWISMHLPDGAIWPDGWCRSFKWGYHYKDMVYDFSAGFNDETKIVVFHGSPNPPDAIPGWKQYPPSPWIEKYWRV